MKTLTRRATVVVVCEGLESRRLFDAISLIPEVAALMENGRLRRPGNSVAVESSETVADAPPLAGTIEAINFDTDGSLNGSGGTLNLHIPPDTHGAAGPGHIVNVVNTSIQWYTKLGVQQNSVRLGKNGVTGSIAGSFFQAQSPVTGLFDPRVMYDQYNSRFVVVAMEQTDTARGDATNSGRMLIAVSDDSDPNGTWFTASTTTKLNISGTDTWADFPQVGIDGNAVYVTGNMFSFGASGTFRGSRLWIIPKTGLYSGGAAAFNVYDPSTAAGMGVQAFSYQPAHMYGAAPGSTGTFLATTSITFGGASEILTVVRVDNPTTSPTFNAQFINLGDIDNGASVFNVPQSGTPTTVAAGDRRLLDAVWRNNALYAVNTISPGSGVDASTATARWYKVNTTIPGSLSLSDSGNVSGEDIATGTRTFYPSISVDQNNNLAIGFSASGPNIFPGAYYTGRLSSDSPGTVQSSGVIAAGQAFYVRTFGGANRWGDYSSVAVDPTDNLTFWTYNLYALNQGLTFGGESGRWGTRWGKFSFASVPPAPSTPDLATVSDSGISNTDNVTNVNTPTFNGTAEAGSTVTIFANGQNVGSGVATGGNYSISTSALADNVYTINATATNGAGPGPLSGNLSVTIDTLAPGAPSVPDLKAASDSGDSNTDNITNVTTPTFTGTAEPNSLVQVFVDGIGNNTGAAVGGNWSISTTTLANGVRSIFGRATDVAGNIGVTTGPMAVTIDTVAPVASTATFDFLTGGTTFAVPFNENVNLPALIGSDFSIQDLTTLDFLNPATVTVSYNAGTNLATMGIVGGIIPNGIYQINVVPSGVVDAAGNQVTGTLSSGPFYFQQGDANRDRAVNTLDFNILAGNFGTAGNWAEGNFDYTGTIDSTDFGILMAEYGRNLPATPAPLPGGLVMSAASGNGSPLFATGDPIHSDGWQDLIYSNPHMQ